MRLIKDDGGASGRWAMLLAGGDGTRLQSLTRLLAGDERPKQFCHVIGGRTLLPHFPAALPETVALGHP